MHNDAFALKLMWDGICPHQGGGSGFPQGVVSAGPFSHLFIFPYLLQVHDLRYIFKS